MMSVREPLQQARDNGNRGRTQNRSPPPFRREEATLQENIPPTLMEGLDYSDDDIPEIQIDDSERSYTSLEARDLGILPEVIDETQQALGQITEISDSDALNESTPEESEDEYSDDEESSDNEILNFSVDRLEPIRKMVLHICRRYEEIFPKEAGKRRVDPHEFDKMLAELRNMF